MIEREIAVVVSNANKGVNAFDTIDAIHKAGYKNVFIQWYNRIWNPTQEEQLKYIRKKGLNVIFVHLGYENINDLWLETNDGNLLVKRYISDIKFCKDNAIPMVVMHLTNEKEAPKCNKIAIIRLQEIADYAKKLGVKVAFENTKFKGYLEYAIENIKNDNVGICFDSGHCHVYFDDDFDFFKFKDRIFAIHLHDNDKKSDLHLIPFDGNIDWRRTIRELKNCNYNGPITMELVYRNDYLQMSIDSFYKKGYEAGKKLRKMFEKEYEIMSFRKPDPEYVKAAHEEFPLAELDAPIPAKDFNGEFHRNWEAADQKWKYKRVTVSGIVRYKGPDIHKIPCFELSDSAEGACEVLACLAGEEEYGDIQVGDTIVVQGNYLIESDTYGVCLKISKVVK